MRTSTNDIIDKYKTYMIWSCVKKLEPIVLVEGSGATVKDLDGKEYIDCFAGISVTNAGHCHPKVVRAVKKQVEKLMHCCVYVYPTIPTAELAEKLAGITPKNLQKTFFCNSGAEAVECSLKLAKKFTKKPELIALLGSFHGRTIGSLSVTGQASRKKYDMGPYLSGVAYAPAPYCYRCFAGLEYPKCDVLCARTLRDVIRFQTSGGVAAFIAEPVLGEGGLIPAPKEYFKMVKEILDANNILLIDDEVQSGFGRTGKLFGIEHYGVEPDLMPMAKGIADGFPIGACIARSDIGDAFEPGDHLSTYGGNPVACAAALANIEVLLDEKLPEQATKKGQYAMKRLNEMMEEYELIGDVRGRGLMIGVELVTDRNTKEPAVDEVVKIRDMAREHGVLFGSGGVDRCTLRIQPPLVITREQLDKALDVLEEGLSKIKEI